MKKLFILFIAVAGFSVSSFAQTNSVNATATSSATIITPLAIAKNTDMNFGNVGVNASLGTVVLTPASTRSATGGVSVTAAMGGTVTAAKFTVTGQGNYTYAITLPSGATTLSSGSSPDMTVDNWTSTPTPTGTLSSGTQDLYVGGTLHVAASQPAGTYLSATPFIVTVNYN